MQLVHFSDDFYDSGVVKFKADSYHPLNSETQSLVNTGYASLVNAEGSAQSVTVLAALALLTAERADAAEETARSLRAEADAAQALVDAAKHQQAQRDADALAVIAAEQAQIANVANADVGGSTNVIP